MERFMKMTFLRYVLISYLIFNASLIHPQERQKTEANSDLIEYTNKEGLPSTNISNIVQTKDGFIWISGIEGTYRFNGYEFEEVGEDIDLPKMQNMYYDSTSNVMYFASPKKLIKFDGNDFKVYTEKEGYKINGLDGQMITFIDADSKGNIWIGSSTPYVDKKCNGGLTKFENGEFTVYDSINFPLDNATNFIETPYGDLIFNSTGHNTQTGEGSYIALFKNGIFQKIDESMGINLQGANMLPKESVTSVDKEGNIWLAFTGQSNSGNFQTNSGVLMYDGNKFHQYQDLANILGKDRYPLEVYYSTLMDKLFLTTFKLNGEIFNGQNNTIYEFDKGKWQPSNIVGKINTIKDLKTGNVINDFRFSSAFFTRPNNYFPELLILLSTNVDQSSKYTNQLFCFKNDKWEKFDAFNGGMGYEINDGVLMPISKGIGMYYPNYSRMLRGKDGLIITQIGIPNLYTDVKGLVWISYSYSELPAYARSENVGINVWDGKRLRAITEKDGLLSNITFQTFQDSKNRIWIATSKGLNDVREITNSDGEQVFKFNIIPDQEGKPYNTSSILETKSGDIYAWENYIRPAEENLIEAGYYLGKFDGEKFVKIISPFSDIDKNKKYQNFDLREDNDGRLWFLGIFSDNIKDISSAPSKIMLYDGKSWNKPAESWNVPSEQLHYVGNLKNGMYFLTVGGFYVFNGEKFVNLSDSVNDNADFRILKGASVAGTKTDIQAGDRLYIRLRNRGLVIFDGTNLNFYTKKEGLPFTNISNPITDELRGNVYFSSPSGALKINGNKFQTFYNDENIVSGGPSTSAMDGFGNMIEFYDGAGLYINKSVEKSYPLKISSVSIADKFHYYKFPAVLPYSQNSFLFNYAALDYKDSKQTTYEHFLEGFDKDWSKPSNIAFAEYQYLPSGHYSFRVRGITSNGVKTNEAAYSFIVSPPFWRTWWAYVLYGLIFIGVAFAVDRIQRRRLVEKGRKLASEKELAQAKEIEKAYIELKATQSQLIQSEKMASLGELTAGIAHEIQNPLNFVNNFSDVSNELIDEMIGEIEMGNTDEAKAIAHDVKQNLEKINHHGNRADAIVKGMLQHSRSSSGVKEPTNINAIADEYLRLAYHGLRAKDKSFNATMKTDFDETIGKINVIPQDIGRVILNLITNAFYVVTEKKKEQPEGYEPTVWVSTKKINGRVEVRVKDNGNGIPKNIFDKVFQPFFTTKPSGEGTGLGLSLSYDIVTKGHHGELKVETKESEGTEFIIVLPEETK
jgi:signal transduction histidine kinase